MYEISVKKHFDAAHYLREYKGKCEDLHGHRFEVVLTVQTDDLNNIGLAFDFTELKKHLDNVLSRFDHVCLNDVEPFRSINPSSENIARIIFSELSETIGEIVISKVEVWESPESRAAYIP